MRKQFPADDLARDERFARVSMAERLRDPRGQATDGRIAPDSENGPERARRQMHGIFVGEIQALEGAGRTAFDYEAGSGDDEVPFELKLDMARQAWDEARHVEISIKLGEHMGFEIGEYAESTVLYEVCCHTDPVFRLAGVNRALEGLAIDVFTTMRDYAAESGDDYLEFAEDWMLADEVTHVKMGSRWLREVTEGDPERRKTALEFQKTVDQMFNFRGRRGDGPEYQTQLARQFREMAGFDTEEVDAIAEMARLEREEFASAQAAG